MSIRPTIVACIAGLCSAGMANAETVKTKTVVWTATECVPPPDSGQAVGPVAGLVLSLIVGPLVKSGINSAGEALQRAGAPRDIHGWHSASTYLYAAGYRRAGNTVEPPLTAPETNSPWTPDMTRGEQVVRFRRPCLVLISGPPSTVAVDEARFAAVAAELERTGRVPTILETGYDPRTSPDAFRLDPTLFRDTGIDALRAAVAVLSIEPSVDATAIRLRPVLVQAGQSFKRGDSKPRSVAFSVSLLPPGATADGAAVALRTITLSGLSGPKMHRGAEAARLATSWMPMPPMPEAAAARLEMAQKRRDDYGALDAAKASATAAAAAKMVADQNRLRTLITADDRYMARLAPYTVRGDVHETAPGDKFLVALGKLLSENAEKGSTALVDAVNPEKRAASAEADTQAVEALRLVAIEAEATLTKARAASDSGGTRAAAIKLGAACRQIAAAGFADPACAALP